MLGALLFVEKILKSKNETWQQLTGTMWCDNQAATKKYNELEGTKPFSISTSNTNDSDVLQELRVVKSKIPIKIQAVWVKGH